MVFVIVYRQRNICSCCLYYYDYGLGKNIRRYNVCVRGQMWAGGWRGKASNCLLRFFADEFSARSWPILRMPSTNPSSIDSPILRFIIYGSTAFTVHLCGFSSPHRLAVFSATFFLLCCFAVFFLCQQWPTIRASCSSLIRLAIGNTFLCSA